MQRPRAQYFFKARTGQGLEATITSFELFVFYPIFNVQLFLKKLLVPRCFP